MDRDTLAGFADELRKLAVAGAQLQVPQTRSGRRPISVQNYLDRDRAGTLFKRVPQPAGDVPSRDGRQGWSAPGAAIQDGRELGQMQPAGMVITDSASGPMPRY